MTSLDVRELLPRDREQWEPLWQQYDAVAARVPLVRYEIDLDAPRGMPAGPTGNPGATSEARRPT